jgi:ElaB/YqjD/DUF883 family membrane-anchored ribosome-binding protein
MTARSTTEIEFETNATRRRVSGLLDELKDRLSPGLIVDEVMGYGSEGSKEFVNTLAAQARRNPLACAIVGAGLAMLMMSEFRPPNSIVASRRPRNGSSDAADVLGRTVDTAESALSATRNAASSAYESARDTAGSAYDATRDAATSAASDISEAAASGYSAAKRLTDTVTGKVVSLEEKAVEMARQGGQRIAQASSTARAASWDLLTDQPLVTAGIGLAIGAAIGAMLPSTDIEDELMGDVSDGMKTQAQDIASDQYEKVKSVAAEEYEKVKSVATEEFEKVKSAAVGEFEKVKSVAAGEFEKAKSVAGEAMGAAEDGIKQMAAEATDTRGDAAETTDGKARDESVMSGIAGTTDSFGKSQDWKKPSGRQMR